MFAVFPQKTEQRTYKQISIIDSKFVPTGRSLLGMNLGSDILYATHSPCEQADETTSVTCIDVVWSAGSHGVGSALSLPPLCRNSEYEIDICVYSWISKLH